eukprot:gene6159-7387_t
MRVGARSSTAAEVEQRAAATGKVSPLARLYARLHRRPSRGEAESTEAEVTEAEPTKAELTGAEPGDAESSHAEAELREDVSLPSVSQEPMTTSTARSESVEPPSSRSLGEPSTSRSTSALLSPSRMLGGMSSSCVLFHYIQRPS